MRAILRVEFLIFIVVKGRTFLYIKRTENQQSAERMSENITNELIYEVLKNIQERLSNLADDMGGVKSRLTSIDTRLGLVHTDMAHLSDRMDRIESRMGRVETRLNLNDVQH